MSRRSRSATVRTTKAEGIGMSNSGGGHVSRRALIAGAVAAGGLMGQGRAVGSPVAHGHAVETAAQAGAVRIAPGDVRYENLLRGNNFRFAGQPDEIRVVTSADQVVRAVDEAVRAGRRI